MRKIIITFHLSVGLMIGCSGGSAEDGRTCETSTLDCGVNGSCQDTEMGPACACDTGYAGDTCERCGSGYQDHDDDGVCAESCATTTTSCGNFGTCSDVTGTASCVCHMGYTGPTCEACASGFQDDDSNGTCLPNCASSGLNCGSDACSTTGGSAVCACTGGRVGDCTVCGAGTQDNDNDGTCTDTCTQAALGCGAYGVCSDASGTAACVCQVGHTGADCGSCDTGYQDDDGDGKCLPECATSDWWDPAYLNRASLTFTNATANRFGAPIRVVIDHAALVADSSSLANGDDVRVVYDNGTALEEVSRATEGGWNLSDTDIVFPARAVVLPGETTTGYWLYWNNAAATAPAAYTPGAPAKVAMDKEDGTGLECPQIGSHFLSIQFRQMIPGTNLFQVYMREHTGDGASFGSIKVTNDANGATLFQKTYTDVGGSCCSPVVDGYATDHFGINVDNFTVELSSREFSNSARYFGCKLFSTGFPQTVGTTIRSYSFAERERPTATTCGF